MRSFEFVEKDIFLDTNILILGYCVGILDLWEVLLWDGSVTNSISFVIEFYGLFCWRLLNFILLEGVETD